LAIIRHRERAPGGGSRSHEAWVLRRVLGWGERDAARALDCSRTALRLHLQQTSAWSPEEEASRIAETRARMDEVPFGGDSIEEALVARRRRGFVLVAIVAAGLTGLAILTRFLP
jgi:hypothetical protein